MGHLDDKYYLTLIKTRRVLSILLELAKDCEKIDDDTYKLRFDRDLEITISGLSNFMLKSKCEEKR
jgi:hypothetical protein